MLHGQVAWFRTPTFTILPGPGTSRFPLSSMARLLSVTDPDADGTHWKLQLGPPLAWCHFVPPSTDTSTAPSAPPPPSLAVPLTAVDAPTNTVVPSAGDVIAEVGVIASIEGLHAVSGDFRLPSSTPMSASHLSVACRM